MLFGRIIAMMDSAGRKAEFGVAAGLALVHLVVSVAASGSPCGSWEPKANRSCRLEGVHCPGGVILTGLDRKFVSAPCRKAKAPPGSRLEGTAYAAIYCEKSENELSSLYESFLVLQRSHRQATIAVPRTRGRRPTKEFSPIFARNALISLDSNERIQGNPRKSNSVRGGFRSERTTRQENPSGPHSSPATSWFYMIIVI
jgi:hypothetical protein